MSDRLTPSQIKAAEEFASQGREQLQAYNAATVIAGVARMAGTLMFRSFNFQFPGAQAGNAALSVEANEKGPKLMQLLGNVLAHIGIEISENYVESNDAEDRPTLDFLETQKLLDAQFDKVRQEHGLSFESAAESAAVAVGLLIKDLGENINKDVAFGIGVYGFIEGSKTIPLPLAS